MEKVVKEYANGVYDAKISIPNSKALKDQNAKPFLEKAGRGKDSVSTMFPRIWNEDRLKVELAFDKKGNISTVYPVRGQ